MWRSATESRCAKLRPEDCGWFVDHSNEKEMFKPIWFNGEASPSTITEILENIG